MAKKLVAVLNKKVDAGRAMNALAHATVGLVASNPDSDFEVVDYADADLSSHLASKLPYIILKAKNSNQIRMLRNELIDRKIPFSSFTESMTVGSWEEQVARSRKTPEIELVYFGICVLGDSSDLDLMTKKFSLWI